MWFVDNLVWRKCSSRQHQMHTHTVSINYVTARTQNAFRKDRSDCESLWICVNCTAEHTRMGFEGRASHAKVPMPFPWRHTFEYVVCFQMDFWTYSANRATHTDIRRHSCERKLAPSSVSHRIDFIENSARTRTAPTHWNKDGRERGKKQTRSNLSFRWGTKSCIS